MQGTTSAEVSGSLLVNADFETPVGWRSGHLQTIRSRVLRRTVDLELVGTSRDLIVDVSEGDQLAVHVHRCKVASKNSMVLLVHGLGGTAESDYVRATAFGLLAAGFDVARVDLRGAGRSGERSRLMYHAGRTEDLRAVLAALAAEPNTMTLAIMGFSLGGNATLKMLGEDNGDLPLAAGISVSAPLDLAVGAQHLQQMAFGVYEKYLLQGLRRDSLRQAPDGSALVTETERAAIAAASGIVDFDDAVTARRNGWRDAAHYYDVNSAGQFLPRIAVPTLVVFAADDPMIPVAPYAAVDWQDLERTGAVRRAITAHGGHVGFHERNAPLPWFVRQAITFISQHRRPTHSGGRRLPAR